MTRQECATALAEKHEEQRVLLAKGDQMELADIDRAEALQGEIEPLEKELAKFNRAVTLGESNTKLATFLATPVGPLGVPGPATAAQPQTTVLAPGVPGLPAIAAAAYGARQALGIPANVRRGRATNFRSLNRLGGPSAEERAYDMGMWLLATIGRSPRAFAVCRERGIELAQVFGEKTESVVQLAHVENINTQGGLAL